VHGASTTHAAKNAGIDPKHAQCASLCALYFKDNTGIKQRRTDNMYIRCRASTSRCVAMDNSMPIGIANVGNSCFLNALLQCLCVPAADADTRSKLDASTNALDKLVKSVVAHRSDAPVQHTAAWDFGVRGASARKARAGAPMELQTPLIREIFDADLGHQGQQCPMHFFSAACASGGVLAERFNATIGEMLTCGECGASLKPPHSWKDNHVQILKFDAKTSAVTLKSLIFDNIISPQIEGYLPEKHKPPGAAGPVCNGKHGAHHVTYFAQALPEHLCFALSSRTNRACKNSRYFAPEHRMELPEVQCSPPGTSSSSAAGPLNVPYELYATITHSGRDSQSGHFSAYVLRGKNWFHLDDEHVESVDAATVLDPPRHNTIYMLFYRREAASSAGCFDRAVQRRTL